MKLFIKVSSPMSASQKNHLYHICHSLFAQFSLNIKHRSIEVYNELQGARNYECLALDG